MAGRVAALHIYPVKGEPGVPLEQVDIGRDGLVGDRRKKAPVHVVAAEDDAPGTRANIRLDLAADELRGAIGGRLWVGEVLLEVTAVPSGCPGVYAAVARPGLVRLGDAAVVDDAPPGNA
jgi:hypothetical protein